MENNEAEKYIDSKKESHEISHLEKREKVSRARKIRRKIEDKLDQMELDTKTAEFNFD